ASGPRESIHPLPEVSTKMSAAASEARLSTGVLIIGSGAAGLRAAIAAHDAGVQPLVLGKRRRDDAHTVLAAGGINAVLGTMDPEDTIQQHVADTLNEGYWLGHPALVEALCEHAHEAVEDLVSLGARLAREQDGRLSQRFFGAHRYRRTCFAGDYTGREVQMSLLSGVQSRGIPMRDDLYITRLLTDGDRCFGAYGFSLDDGSRTVILADAVVLAAGGHTRIFRRSSSRRDENTGDAMRLALGAGAQLQDMELVQFHPTGMIVPEDVAGTLVTEAVRGEGGILRNGEGERFMERYDPERMELTTRDRLALANYTEIAEGRGTANGGVLLDITHLPADQILERLPRMYRQFIDLAMVDITRQPMEVAPTAHYSMGGVAVDPYNHRTAVDGLYAVGECAAGLHGANRLGGNSLAECVVFGAAVGRDAARDAMARTTVHRDPEALVLAREEIDHYLRGDGRDFARPLQRELRDIMSEHCGVVRDAAGLQAGMDRLDRLAEQARGVVARPDLAGYRDLATCFELDAMILSARATVRSAMERTESRGCHVRSDHPDLDPAQQHNLRIDADERVTAVPLPRPDASLLELGAVTAQASLAGRLLE
ncbi:MAG: succinate dehydrogenase, partial [Solirubrobacterales bacterium]|nr:succinate dehydrogenase [Solirubrobacterales bacterium]